MKTNSVLTVSEYQRVQIDDLFITDSDNPSITVSQAREIERATLEIGNGFCEFGARSVRFAQFVGVIQFGDWTLEVLPKTDDKSSNSQVRDCLLEMLQHAHKLPAKMAGRASLRLKNCDFLEAYARVYCQHLLELIRSGMIRNYQQKEETLSVVRGKIVIQEQLRKNILHPERIHCVFDEFSEDNQHNRILKAALNVLNRSCRLVETQKLVRELLFIFCDVSDIKITPTSFDNLPSNRMVDRYEMAMNMASIILRGVNPDMASGAQQAFSLLFDMNEIFEEFIGNRLRRIFGSGIRLQGPRKYLVKVKGSGRSLFQMKPDVSFNEGRSWILDTKWKLLDLTDSKLKVSQPDLYQMLAYATRYGCPDIVLLYPHHQGMSAEHGVLRQFEFLNAQGEGMQRVYIATVNIGREDDRGITKDVDRQLRQIISTLADSEKPELHLAS